MKQLYGYIALRQSDPDICKAGFSDDPINRLENTWSDEACGAQVVMLKGIIEADVTYKQLTAKAAA